MDPGLADAPSVFTTRDRLQTLRAAARTGFASCDALLLPVTPGHPTLAEGAADPVGVKTRLGRFTNVASLLDMCAIAVPAGMRSDGLPFGVQLGTRAFAGRQLLDFGSGWGAEIVTALPPVDIRPSAGSRCLVAVAERT